ncbi:TNF receptor-associated factor 1-like isoform X1 [Scyliorhinus canicula]|uniref:TNF receptor-associated factor 1-like isoform X1 n=2 Tax=Scyliorhinus canicula TaxID=7830 RepID=UPI0018F6F627|nr:TNF receptor-associated factor 1-like isoform X1 [Scyliorhinus canicula]XP_038638391.1 TNF receptor-associated factor 1-like isoform X1 [Scyliorhinus canicula]
MLQERRLPGYWTLKSRDNQKAGVDKLRTLNGCTLGYISRLKQGLRFQSTSLAAKCFEKGHTTYVYIECNGHKAKMDVRMSGQLKLPDAKIDDSEDKDYKKKSSCCFRAVGCRFKGGKSKIQEHEAGGIRQHLNFLMDEVTKLNQKAISANLPPDISRTLKQMEAEADKIELRIKPFQKDHQINEVCKELQEFGKLLEETKQCVTMVEARLSALDDRLTALPREINKCSRMSTTLNRQIELTNLQFIDVEGKLTNCESKLFQTEKVIEETTAQMMALETMTQTGIYIWKIPHIKKRLQEAIDGITPYLDSSEFYFCKYGYRICLRIYLDGYEEAQGTHISLYYILLKGQFDALTQWPFKQNVKLALLNLNDRQQSILKIYVPDEQDPALQRPVQSMNAPRGFPMFATSSEFNQRFSEFVMGDEMFVGAEVVPIN